MANSKAEIHTLPFYILKIVGELSNSEESVEVPIVPGKAAGIWTLAQNLFPPEYVSRSSFPAAFTIQVEPRRRYVVDIEVELVHTSSVTKEFIVMGHLGAGICSDLELHGREQKHLYAIARYNAKNRTGVIVISKGVFSRINEKYNPSSSFRVREL